MDDVLLEVKHLGKRYPIYGPFGKLFGAKHFQQAVADVSFRIREGETYGLVGESGCGKTTTGQSILGMVRPDSGEILYRGVDLLKLDAKARRAYSSEIQLIFQDPLSAMNPRMRIGSILEEPLRIQRRGTPQDRKQKVLEILRKTGLSEEHYFRFPHELSGGQVQRLAIAGALIIEPKLIVCDEPVSALDVSVQAQILNLLRSLQKEMGLSLLFISHDMGVIRYISHRIGVMYLGSKVEEADTDELFERPMHPYTRALLESVPDL